ncbi:MAG TPA: hypothetical protein VHA80_10480 [Solirubrobacterales bacterium]|jgi:hypothetical protein|nr:hypothetical protein [Solirubrobacterales bacterium]HVY96784.1 hypothetical protein [Solirubrobacterales bacterium]
MRFHVEVATGRLHARSFNLTEEELGRTVLDPWLSGRPILLGDRRWTRDGETSLRVLEGPELSVQDLAFSQGWANAQRASTDVTARVLDAATEGRRARRGPAAIVIKADSAVQAVADLVSGQESEAVSIEEVRERIDGDDPSVAAVILVVQKD